MTRRRLLAAFAGALLAATATTAVVADGSHDYFSTVVSTTPSTTDAPSSWTAGKSPTSATDQHQGNSGYGCGNVGPNTAYWNRPRVGPYDLVAIGFCAGGSLGAGTPGDQVNFNRPGPFPGDASDGATQLVGARGTTDPILAAAFPGQTDPATPLFYNFWFKPEVATNVGGDAQWVFMTGLNGTGHFHDDGIGDWYSYDPPASQLYISSPDNFAHLCFGQQGGADSAVGFGSGNPVVAQQHCISYYGLSSWHMLSLYYSGVSSGGHSATLQLGVDDTIKHTMTGIYPRDPGTGPCFGGSSGTENYAFDIWGMGDWTGQAAIDMMDPHLASNPNGFLPALFYAAGTGQPPAGTSILPGQGATGGCASGQSPGVLSGLCKFQFGTIAATDCAAQSSGHNWWDVGADVTTALCYLGNIFIGVANTFIAMGNAIIDLLIPSASLLDPVKTLGGSLSTHAPFAYISQGLGGLSDALAASPRSFSLSLGSPTPLDITGHLSVLDPYRAPMVAVIWLGAVVGIVRHARGDLSGGAES